MTTIITANGITVEVPQAVVAESDAAVEAYVRDAEATALAAQAAAAAAHTQPES